MTDTAARAEWRWGLAEAQAQRVLAAPPPRRVSTRLLVTLLTVTLVVVFGGALVSAPESVGRWATAGVGALVGLGLIAVDIARTIRDRRRPEWPLVTGPLTSRERQAVGRVLRGSTTAPEDRQGVVRGAALQTGAGRALRVAVGQFLVFTAITCSGSGVWFIWAVVAVVNAVGVGFALRDTATARRWLDAHPVRP